MISRWIFEHAMPGGAIALAWLLMLGLTGVSLWRHLRTERTAPWIALLRLAFLILLGWVLLLPARRSTLTETLRPRFVVALDTSASMQQAPEDETTDTTSRWDVATLMLARDWQRRIATRCRIDLAPFDAEAYPPIPPDQTDQLAPAGGATRLRNALEQTLARYRGQHLAGILLLSDGLDTHESTTAWIGDLPWPAPVHVVELEPPKVVEIKPDVRVEAIDTPHRAVVEWETQLSATIGGQGIPEEPFTVRLLRDGRLFQEQPVLLPPEGGMRNLTFRLPHPNTGIETWTVQIPTLPGEIQTNDNSMAVAVEVVDARNRLLYVEDVPRWESKYLNRELHANRDITPLAFIRGPGGRFMPFTAAAANVSLDMTPDQLGQYKIIILGDLDAEALGAARADALKDFVERGGSLVLLGGPRAWTTGGLRETSLAELLPFSRGGERLREGRFASRWAEEGRGHPALAGVEELPEPLPPVLTFFADARPNEAAMTLVEAEAAPGAWQPLIVSRIYGQGKVVAFLTDSLWRWQLQPGAGRPYPLLWRQLTEWLSPSEDERAGDALEILGGASTFSAGEEIELRARLTMADGQIPDDLRVVCELLTPDNRTLPFTMTAGTIRAGGAEFPGFTTSFTPQSPGSYRAVTQTEIRGRRIRSAPFIFQVRAFTSETTPRPANALVLRAIAQASGGRYGPPEAIDRYLQSLQVETRREQRVEYRTGWQTRTILLLLMALLIVEWSLRKLKGLI